MIVISAKAADVAGAAAAARRVMCEGSVVVTIQNGLGSADVVAAELGGELGAGSLMVAIAGGFGASIRAPGHAHHNGRQTIRMGAYSNAPGGLDFERAGRAVGLWPAACAAAGAAGDIAPLDREIQ